MEAVRTSDMSVNFYQTTQRDVPEDSSLQHYIIIIIIGVGIIITVGCFLRLQASQSPLLRCRGVYECHRAVSEQHQQDPA
jgi:hypothetical protein